MSLCSKIQDAKTCVSKFAERYVKAVTFGVDTDDLFYELMLLVGYVESLERYECNPTRNLTTRNLLTYEDFLLTDNNKILSLGDTCETVCLDPDEVNCLSKDEVCFILEQISLKCESCSCGC